jgi:hypothetical protein
MKILLICLILISPLISSSKLDVTLVINELTASNSSGIQDPQGQNDDWIEIHNYGMNTIDIAGMYLTDDLSIPNKWRFPAGTSIQSGGYLIVWADEDITDAGLHTNFKLDANGEEIGLFDNDGITLIDSITFSTQITDISYGRYPDAADQWRFFGDPSPEQQNNYGYLGIVADTKFSHDRGFYSVPFEVEITTDTPGAMIVYTTDGSIPIIDDNFNIVNGMLYTEPITISGTTNLRVAAFKSEYLATNVDTQTYLFTSDIIQQTHESALAAGLPSWWGSRSADYGLDPDVIGPGDLFGGVYTAIIEDSLTSIPTISLTLDKDDFFGPTGIYTNIQGRDELWERPASAELIFPDGHEGFQINAGLRIHGSASRHLSRKNGLRLLFKSQYGPTKLEYPLFGEEGVTEFDTIVLRPHFNDGWGWDGALDDPLYIRDQWFRNTQAAMGHVSSRGNVVHLYVNGLYWGLYNPSERPDDSFAAEHFGGEKQEYDVVYHSGLHSGSITAYNTMISMARQVSSAPRDTAKNAAYQLLQGNFPDGTNDPTSEDYLDVTNYIDYMILNHYGGNDDWPQRNWFSSRRRGIESEGFRFFAWDSEISLCLSSRTSIDESYVGLTNGAAQAYGYLRDYNEFRLQFADRVHYHLFNGGTLYVNPDNPQYDPDNPQDNIPADRFDALSRTVYDAIVAESARWGDQHVSTPRTRNIDWQNELDYMLETYFTLRHNIVLAQWRSADLYPSIDAPEFLINNVRRHGGKISSVDLLGFQNPNASPVGIIYYTLDGSEPRLIGGAINTSSALVFSDEFMLSVSTHIKARILQNGQWSALTESVFTVPNSNADFHLLGRK